jgi:hypothetical protein
MTKKATKEEAKPQEPEESSNDFFSSLMTKHKEDLFNHITPLNRFISSGSLTLDQYVKARSGGVIRIVAKQAEAGKTSQSFVYAFEFMRTMPRSKTVYFMAEGRLSPEMKARSGHTFVYHPKDWVYGTILIVATNTFETVADFIANGSKEAFEKDERLCFILDSLDGLILKNDKDTKGISDGKVAGVPKLTKLLFRHVALPITFYDILLIITGQYSADIKIDLYAPNVPRLGEASGGNSVPHQCDYILQYLPRYGGDFILENPDAKPDPIKNKIVGVWATVEIKKSATDVSGTKVKVPIKKGRVGSAIWVEKEVVDVALSFDKIKRSGAWFSFAEDVRAEAKEASVELKEKIQGLNALYDYVENDRAVFEWLYAKFRKLVVSE